MFRINISKKEEDKFWHTLKNNKTTGPRQLSIFTENIPLNKGYSFETFYDRNTIYQNPKILNKKMQKTLKWYGTQTTNWLRHNDAYRKYTNVKQSVAPHSSQTTIATRKNVIAILTCWSWPPCMTVFPHVFTNSIYYGLIVKNSPNLSEWELQPVTCWSKFLPITLRWKVPVSFTKTGGFWEPVRGIMNGGSWVVIHMMEHLQRVWSLMSRNIFWENGWLLKTTSTFL